MVEVSYFNFAENDYMFLKHSYDEGLCGNAMAYIAQNICERCLKEILSSYYTPTNENLNLYTNVMQTHSLKKLLTFLEDVIPDFKCDYKKIVCADGYYFSAVYPGYDSFFVAKSDIEDCCEAISEVRNTVTHFINTHEKSNLQTLIHFNNPFEK